MVGQRGERKAEKNEVPYNLSLTLTKPLKFS